MGMLLEFGINHNQLPRIHAINEPSILYVGEQGICKINASDSKNRLFRYTIR